MPSRWIWITLLPLCACAQDRYWVELSPTDSGFTRRLALLRRDGTPDALRAEAGRTKLVTGGKALDPAEVERLLAVYGGPAKSESGVSGLGLAADFDEAIPSDLGGAGFLTRLDSPLGSLWTYAERLRGDDDLLRQRERRAAAFEQLFGLYLGYLDQELSGEAGWGPLRAWIDGPLRADLRLFLETLGLELLVREGGAPSAAGGELSEPEGRVILARLCLFLYERGYLDAPLAATLLAEQELEFSRSLLRRLRRGRLAGCIDFLEGLGSERGQALFGEQASARFEAYVDEPARLAQLQVWYAAERAPSEPASASAHELIERLGRAALGLRLFQDYDRLDLRLNCAQRPLYTNGEWLEETRQLRWQARLDERREGAASYPRVLFASWVHSDGAAQQRLLRGRELSASALAEFVAWWDGLDGAELEAWEDISASGSLDLEALRALAAEVGQPWEAAAGILGG